VRTSKKRDGSVLATVLMLSMMIAIITMVVANNTLTSFKATTWATDAGTSRYIAYAGIQHAMMRLSAQNDFEGTFTGNVDGRPELTYEVRVTNTLVRNPMPSVGGPLGGGTRITVAPERSAKIVSTVKFADTGRTDRSLSGMVAVAAWKPTAFRNAATGNALVALRGGSQTQAFDFNWYDDWERDTYSGYDAYVSPPGPPGGGPGGGPSGTPTPRPPGSSFSDGSADVQTAHLVRTSADSKIEGNVLAPPEDTSSGGTTTNTGSSLGGIAGIVNSGSTASAGLSSTLSTVAPDLQALLASLTAPIETVNFTGQRQTPTQAPQIRAAAPPYPRQEAVAELSDFPGTQVGSGPGSHTIDDSLNPAAYKRIHVPAGQTLRLRPGRYYISEELVIDGKLEVEDGSMDDVVIYVGQKMEVGGSGEVNFHGSPAQMQVYFTDEKIPTNPQTGLPYAAGEPEAAMTYSELVMRPGARATIVAQGQKLITRLDNARLLGSVAGEAVLLDNGSRIEYDTNLKDRQMAGSSPWKLEGVRETVGQ
jgi:hypothetical protein